MHRRCSVWYMLRPATQQAVLWVTATPHKKGVFGTAISAAAVALSEESRQTLRVRHASGQCLQQKKRNFVLHEGKAEKRRPSCVCG